MREFEMHNMIVEYNRLHEILSNPFIEIVDVLYTDTEIQVFCNDTVDEVPFIERFQYPERGEPYE